MIIDINDQTNRLTREQLIKLEQIIAFTLKKEKMPDNCEVSLTFVNDEEIKQLNFQYREINDPTDVLSFPMLSADEITNQEAVTDQPLLLGDIIVSVETAIKQAEQYNHSFKRELAFLVVHGLLHLLGYTHYNGQEEKKMFAKQDEILGAFEIERT